MFSYASDFWLHQGERCTAPRIAALIALIASGPSLAGSADVYTQYVDGSRAKIGKLFTNAGWCSASVVSGNNVVVTTAHCCWDCTQNQWIGGWTIAPAYNNGNAPYGIFS